MYLPESSWGVGCFHKKWPTRWQHLNVALGLYQLKSWVRINKSKNSRQELEKFKANSKPTKPTRNKQNLWGIRPVSSVNLAFFYNQNNMNIPNSPPSLWLGIYNIPFHPILSRIACVRSLSVWGERNFPLYSRFFWLSNNQIDMKQSSKRK